MMRFFDLGIALTSMPTRAQQNVFASLIVWLLTVILTMTWQYFLTHSYTGTVGEFFEKFKDHGYLTKLTGGEKQLEIRLVCEEDWIVSTDQFPLCHY